MFIVMVSAKKVRSVIEVEAPGFTIEVQTGTKRTYYDFYTVDSAERIVYHERVPIDLVALAALQKAKS